MSSKSRTEEYLRAELRSLREIGFHLCRWGVTVQVGICTALYFIRRDVWETLTRRHLIPENTPLPNQNYWIGTLGLIIIASVFSVLTLLTTLNYWHYQEQLLAVNESEIKTTPRNRQAIGLLLMIFLYFLFPIADRLLRIYKLDIGMLW